jgi:hypothetical protein
MSEDGALCRETEKLCGSFLVLRDLARNINLKHGVHLKRSEAALSVQDFADNGTYGYRHGTADASYYVLTVLNYRRKAAHYRSAFLRYLDPEQLPEFETHWARVEPVVNAIRENLGELKAKGYDVQPLYKTRGSNKTLRSVEKYILRVNVLH